LVVLLFSSLPCGESGLELQSGSYFSLSPFSFSMLFSSLVSLLWFPLLFLSFSLHNIVFSLLPASSHSQSQMVE
jgi:hypothetical protein